MKWTAKSPLKSLHCAIEYDAPVGFYLHVYDNSGLCIRDDLQDTLEWAKTVAFEDYGIPKDAWKEDV